MTVGDLILLAGVVIGSLATLGAVMAVLLLWFRGSLRKVALLMAGASGFVLLMTVITNLSPDGLAMAVGLLFGVLALTPALGIMRAAADPHSRAHACDDAYYLYVDSPAAQLDTDSGDYIDVVAIERNHKQLTRGKHYGQRV